MIDVVIIIALVLVFGILSAIQFMMWIDDYHHSLWFPMSCVIFIFNFAWMHGAFTTAQVVESKQTNYKIVTIEWDGKTESFYDNGKLVPLSDVDLPNADGELYALRKTESRLEGCGLHTENKVDWELVKVRD